MALSIEIRANELLFVYVRNRMGGQIETIDSFEIGIEGATIDKDFDLLNKDLSTAIRDELDRRDIEERFVTVILNNRMGISRELEIPKTNKKNMVNIARNELKVKLDIGYDYVVDVMRLSSLMKEGTPYERVMAVAIKYSDIEKIEAWTQQFDMKLKSVQTGPSSMITLLSQQGLIEEDKIVIFIDFTSTYFRLYLYRGNNYLFMRTISNPPGKHDQTNERFLSIIKVLNSELEQYDGSQISELIVTSRVNNLDRHKQFFGEHAGLEINFFNLKKIDKIIENEDHALLGYLNAIGALV